MPKDSKQLMEIEVTFGNRSDYVIVHHGDDAYDLAKAFVRKHKLKESSINPICDYIEATIDEYLIANPDKDRRNTTDSNDSSFDYENVPMRYHNPIVEVVEPPKPKEKAPVERSRVNSGDKQHSTDNHSAMGSNHNPTSSSSTAAVAKTPIPKQPVPQSPTNHVKSSESDLVKLAKQELNAPDTVTKPPVPPPIVVNGERERKNSGQPPTPHSVQGSATSDHSSAHIRQSPLRIRGSNSEFFLETKGQTQPDPTGSSDSHHPTHKPHPHGQPQHQHSKQYEGFDKSMLYSASDIELLNSLDDPNAVDHRQFQANLDRNLNSSLSNFSYRKMATEIVSSSRTPSVTSEYSQHSRSSNTRRHFGDGRTKLHKKSPTQKGIALHSQFPVNQDDSGEGRGSDYEVDEVEYDLNRSANSNDSVLGIKEGGVSPRHSPRRHSSDGQHSPYPVTLDPSANRSGSGHNTRKGKVVVKTANERLYLSAPALKKRQELREQQAAKQQKEEMEKNQFKLNEASRRMVQRLSVKSSDGGHVGVRLYAEGVKEKQMKLKRADNMQGISVCEEWSCARCGKFNKITTANVVIQPLSQAESHGSDMRGNNAAQLQNKVVKICSCGWDQGAVQTFKPVNIGLKLHEDAEGVTANRRHTSEGIHEQLYNEAREKERVHLMNQAFHQEAVIKSMSSFTPTISEVSKSIVNNYVAGNGPNTSSSEGRSLSASRRSAANGSIAKSSAIVGPQLGEYFSIPTVERLSRTKTREIDEYHTLYKQPDPSLSRTNSRSRSRSRSRSMSRSRTGTTGGGTNTEEPPPLSKHDKFIERLVYEYKEKAEKVKDLTKSVYGHDPKTGQVMFQPVVPVLPADIYHVPPPPPVEEVKGKKQQQEFVNNILQRDHELKMKKLKAQKEAELRELEQLKSSKAKALENSDAILKSATDRNIDDLFHLLTMQNTATDENTHANNSGTADDSWRNVSVDLLWVNKDVMIDEVSKLLVEIRNEKLNQLQREKKTDVLQTQKLLVNLEEFRKLALKSIKKRDGTGKAYIYAPKKKPEVALQMIKEDQKQETFRPRMDKNSLELTQSRQKRLTEEPIESILQQEGDKLREKVESARQELILRQSKEFSFQPRLYKSNVQARYKGMDDNMMSGSVSDSRGNNDESMLDSELASTSQGSRSGGGSNVIDAREFLARAYPPPPPLPTEVAEQQLKAVRNGLSKPQPSKDYIPIQKPHINTSRPRKGKSANKDVMTPLSAAGSLRVSSDEEFEELFSISTSGLSGASPKIAAPSINMSVSASSYSNSYAPKPTATTLSTTTVKKKPASNTGASSASKSGYKKAVAKPLPMLPFEALSASYVTGGFDSSDRRSSGGSGVGGMTIAELRRVSTRLSVDSGLTHSTSSTVVKKRP